ncbi:hypothetical protein DB347_17915 [Opitutaceae bacterium EW11]|nr:hypothetical protein DB347_17915 [Opitutaceae bacterium EW11]
MNQFFDNSLGLLLAAFTFGSGTAGSKWYLVLAPLCAIGVVKLLGNLRRKPQRLSSKKVHDLR